MSEQLDYINLHGKINEYINSELWTVIGVNAETSDEVSFAYTVGLHSLGLPEILYAGPYSASIVSTYLNKVGNCFKDKEIKPCSQILKDFIDTKSGLMDAKIIELDPQRQVLHDEYAVHLFEHYSNEKDKIRIVQLYIPDHNGNFADSKDWDAGPVINFVPKNMVAKLS